MLLSGIIPESVVDGPGLRFVIFTQGCPHKCSHCHNPETWTSNAGKEFSIREITRFLKKQKKSIRGITFSGGEPFLQADELTKVAIEAHKIGLDVVTYTGFTYEQLIKDDNASVKALLYESDILIDGKYVHELRNIRLQFCGSSNQRIIDISETLKNNRIVLWNERQRYKITSESYSFLGLAK